MSRIKLEIPENVLANVSIPVRITDINYGNHVGNDSFVGIVQEARVLWLMTGGYDELNIEGAGLIMSDLAMEYKNESYYGDILEIKIGVNEISKISFNLYYVLTVKRKDIELLVAKAKTGMVCYDYKARKITALPVRFITFLTK
ncbi:MAG TPA: thioesterase family protein [Ferruginibacter sp.]|nr:thioesterase family protein [Ferruginibacter sp.]